MTGTAAIALLTATPVMADSQKAQNTQAQQAQTGSVAFVSKQSKNEWLGSTLIGRNVENSNGDSLGDINNIVVDENGSVTAVVIGVGGFLGIGEKDVGVKFSALEFKKDENRTAAYQATNKSQNPAMNPQAAKEQRADNSGKTADERRNEQMQMTARKQAQRNAAKAETADHSNMVIVLNTTKEQLESAPTYKYLGEEREASENQKTQDSMKSENKKKQ